MKCPKCHYIGFEPSDRCRNCGFDFSLSPVKAGDDDLPLRSEEMGAPLADFDLGEARRSPDETSAARSAKRRHDPSLDPGTPPSSVGELPLFGDIFPDQLPLVRPSAPSTPLSVRRSTPTPARSRPAVTPRRLEGEPEPGLPLGSPSPLAAPASGAAAPAAEADGRVAGVGARMGAAAFDGLILVALDFAIAYFTMRVSRLPTAEWLQLPWAPLVAFLVLLNVGYLAVFTAAGGQTLGKMAFHLKVVPTGERPLTIGRALVRVVVLVLSALPVGLGLLPAAFDRAHRGLHDRLARTRVVHAAGS